MSDDQFTQLMSKLENHDRSFTSVTQQMNSRFDAIEKHLDNYATRDQLSTVYDLLSKNIAERQEQERAAMNHQLNRHEQAIDQLADHVGTKLHYAE